MTPQGWTLLLLTMGTVTVLTSAARQVNRESLRSALEAVVRKQRSLDSQEYYNDLHSFKYHGGDAERKFDLDDDDEEIEFLSNDNGQLETVGDGFQTLNNKLLERALLDYLESLPEQEEPVVSIFRERERSSNRKRTNDRLNIKDLAKLLYELGYDGSPYDPVTEMDNYLPVLQTLYDKYKTGRRNKIYESAEPMSWNELLNKRTLLTGQPKESNDNELIDQSILSPAERRNVNGRYPIGREFGSYRRLAKRYPVAKRSPGPIQAKATDPKVAQDLGVLFGTQSTSNHNGTYDADHNHEYDSEHDRDHLKQRNRENSSEKSPKVTPNGQKENATKAGKSKFVQVKKKSVDWSQYFGIDRRKKKATFMAGQGTQNQDDEWMLQRYYENMAENLKPKEDEQKDKLEQMDSKLKYIKDLIIEEALRYANTEEDGDLQKVKDKLMARMAAAYSLQKMRKALSDLRNNAAAQKEAQKTQEAQNNLTSSYRDVSRDSHINNGDSHINNGDSHINNGDSHINSDSDKTNDKRSSNNMNDKSDEEANSCSELEVIEWRCKTVDYLTGDAARMLYIPCVMLQICKACTQDEEESLSCLSNYATETSKLCDALDSRKEHTPKVSREERQTCANTALLLSQLQPPAAAVLQCRVNGNESCLRRYHDRYGHPFHGFRSPYDRHRFRDGFDAVALQQPSDR